MRFSDRLLAIETARQKLASQPLYLDTETTGIEVNDEIIEISLIDDAGQALFESLVRPTRPIPLAASRIHGITNDMVANAPNWMTVWSGLQAVLQSQILGIYNAEFDLRLIKQSHARANLRWPGNPGFMPFCIMKLYAQYVGEWNSARGGYRWHTLEAAGRQCQLSLSNSHRAKDDNLLARAVLHCIAETAIV